MDDEEEDQLFVQEEDSESEQSEGGGGSWTCLSLRDRNIVKDGVTKWNVHCPPRNVLTPAVNLVRCLPGVRQNLEFESPVSALRLIFTTDILDDIVTQTNQLIQKVRPNFTRERDAKDTTGDKNWKHSLDFCTWPAFFAPHISACMTFGQQTVLV